MLKYYCVLAVIAFLFAAGCNQKGADNGKIEANIRQNINIGSDATDVTAFLDSNNVIHSPLTKEDKKNVIHAIVIGESQPDGLRKYILATFCFDDNNKLMEYDLASEYRKEMEVNVTKDEIEEKIQKNIKQGDNVNVIISFLDNNNIEHSPVMIGNNVNVVRARIKDASHTIFVRESILMVFYLDNNNRLVKYEIKTGYTGI